MAKYMYTDCSGSVAWTRKRKYDLPLRNFRVHNMVEADVATLNIRVSADIIRHIDESEVPMIHETIHNRLNWVGADQIKSFDVRKVIYHGPATIVYWGDGSRTVVKTQNGEPFDLEKGFAMACLKHLFDDKGNYNEFVKKWANEKNIKE